MEKTVFISMPVEDLENLIIDCVRTGLKYSPQPKRQPKEKKQLPKGKSQIDKKEVYHG